MYEIVVDTGGTFTDAILIDDERRIYMAKVPTDRINPSKGVMGNIERFGEQLRRSTQDLLKDTSTIVVGTTLPTNTVVVSCKP